MVGRGKGSRSIDDQRELTGLMTAPPWASVPSRVNCGSFGTFDAADVHSVIVDSRAKSVQRAREGRRLWRLSVILNEIFRTLLPMYREEEERRIFAKLEILFIYTWHFLYNFEMCNVL